MKKKYISFNVSFNSDRLEGVWDRIMTYGEKKKDNTTFSFNDSTFKQIINNFAQSKRDRIGYDYEHQVMNAPLNGQPAPNLAYCNALAIIKNKQLIHFFSKDPGVQRPDPTQREDGLYAFRFAVTELGKKLIPNYHELSPLFNPDDVNERGERIGYNLNNISFVNIAFQEGTTVGFNKGNKQMMDDKELYTKLGMKDEPSHDQLKDHLKMMMTDKGFMERMMKSSMSDENSQEREADAEHIRDEMREKADPERFPEMKKSKMSEDISMPKSGKDGMINTAEEDEEDEIKDLDREQKKMMARMSKELSEAKKKLAVLEAQEAKRASADLEAKATAFAKQAVADGRWPADGLNKLIGLAKAGKGEDAIAPMQAGTFGSQALGKKMFAGGNPVTNDKTSFYPGTKEENEVIGIALSKHIKEYAVKNKIELDHTNYKTIAKEILSSNPGLY